MAEEVYTQYGRFEIFPGRMQDYIRQQEMDDGEIARIVKARLMHLDWMHKHFAYEILEPPEDCDPIESPGDAE